MHIIEPGLCFHRGLSRRRRTIRALTFPHPPAPAPGRPQRQGPVAQGFDEAGGGHDPVRTDGRDLVLLVQVPNQVGRGRILEAAPRADQVRPRLRLELPRLLGDGPPVRPSGGVGRAEVPAVQVSELEREGGVPRRLVEALIEVDLVAHRDPPGLGLSPSLDPHLHEPRMLDGLDLPCPLAASLARGE